MEAQGSTRAASEFIGSGDLAQGHNAGSTNRRSPNCYTLRALWFGRFYYISMFPLYIYTIKASLGLIKVTERRAQLIPYRSNHCECVSNNETFPYSMPSTGTKDDKRPKQPRSALRVHVPSELEGIAFIQVVIQKESEQLVSANLSHNQN